MGDVLSRTDDEVTSEVSRLINKGRPRRAWAVGMKQIGQRLPAEVSATLAFQTALAFSLAKVRQPAITFKDLSHYKDFSPTLEVDGLRDSVLALVRRGDLEAAGALLPEAARAAAALGEKNRLIVLQYVRARIAHKAGRRKSIASARSNYALALEQWAALGPQADMVWVRNCTFWHLKLSFSLGEPKLKQRLTQAAKFRETEPRLDKRITITVYALMGSVLDPHRQPDQW